MSYQTLAERKRAKVAAMSAAVDVLADALAEYAHRNGGRFILFGSAARGEIRFGSDIDIVVDFPAGSDQGAWDFAEERAFALALKPDVHKLGWLGDRLRSRVAAEGRILSRGTRAGMTSCGRARRRTPSMPPGCS